RVNGLTYSWLSACSAIFAGTAGRTSGNRLEIREELRVRLRHLLDEPELDALRPRQRRPELLLLDEDADVLLPRGHGVLRDAGVERHVAEGLARDGGVESRRPAGGDLRCLVRMLPRVLRRLRD